MFGGETLTDLALTVRYVGLAFVLYYSLVFSYRLLLHLLRHYPGPLLAEITDGYGGSHVYQLTLQASGFDSIFNRVDRDRHRFKRRLIPKVVSVHSIRLFEPTMKDQVQIFLRLLLASSQEPNNPSPVNMSERCKRLGLDIIGLLAFGFPLNTPTDEEYRFIIKGIAFGNYRSISHMQFPALKNRFLHELLHVMTRKGRLGYLKALERIISTRLAMDKHVKTNFYSFLAEHIETGGPDSI